MHNDRHPAPVRGTSLVEALVALAVMAFGMLAVVGVQSTLRLNADVAKQRSEAVRIGQEAIEAARAFTAVDNPASGQASYGAIATAGATSVSGYTTNTSYTVTRTVAERSDPARKELRVEVAWTDRSGQAQQITLDSTIAAIDPRVPLLLAARPAGIPPRLPRGRSPLVPPGAVAIAGGSAYQPPGAPAGEVWYFDNATGVITSVCIGGLCDSNPRADCSSSRPCARISGFVRFDLGDTPNAATANVPPQGLLVEALAGNADSVNGVCYAQYQPAPPAYIKYECRVPLGSIGWTGRVDLSPPGTEPELPDGWTALDLDQVDVCRYLNPAPGNAGHPRRYQALAGSLTDQNFLVVRQGIACPAGTAAHQPAAD